MEKEETAARVMIVEDEVIVSTDLKRKIERMGYVVCDCIHYGEEALDSARETKPDIVLMDVNLKGEMNGTEAARQIVEELNIPIIFLTAFSDDITISQAKKSGPFGYLTKPIRFEELKINLEMALYKEKLNRQLKEQEIRFRTIADFAYDWETWISPDGELLYTSPSCLRMTGYSREEFENDPELLYSIAHPDEKNNISESFKCHHEHDDKAKIIFPILHRNGNKVWLEHICQAVYSPQGEYLGRRASNRDITERKAVEDAKEQLLQELKKAMNDIKTMGELLPICCECKKIRDDEGYWNQVEEYINKRTGFKFSHGLCPDCAKNLYPEHFKKS